MDNTLNRQALKPKEGIADAGGRLGRGSRSITGETGTITGANAVLKLNQIRSKFDLTNTKFRTIIVRLNSKWIEEERCYYNMQWLDDEMLQQCPCLFAVSKIGQDSAATAWS
ncbi:hypothetical protein CHS0354_013473 [Potamilus streckersoni]|uniref:Uncharacterized protein n=1 Tax=Potamilus streckersoni TaxID=2493646 RepID=A0AAE0T8E7_9BIVA|nr:hypothetical protein CHS0354_013473 [Potamilus streckersoni]